MGSIQKKFVVACLKFCRDSGRESRRQFRFPLPILARFPARSHRDFCHHEFASFSTLGENLGKLRGRIPAKFWPPGLLLPGKNHGEIRSRIVLRFWPPGFLLLRENLGEICGSILARFWPTGILLPSENLGEIRSRITPRFWPLGFLLFSENLGEFRGRIPARCLPGRNIPAAKMSPGFRRDSRRDRGGIPPRSRSLFYKGKC